MKQYGPPTEDPFDKKEDDDGDDESSKNKQRFMYFIRSGEFHVTIESNFNAGISADDEND